GGAERGNRCNRNGRHDRRDERVARQRSHNPGHDVKLLHGPRRTRPVSPARQSFPLEIEFFTLYDSPTDQKEILFHIPLTFRPTRSKPQDRTAWTPSTGKSSP